MVATKPAAEVAQSFEDQMKPNGGHDLKGVIEEVRQAQSDPKFMEELNAKLHDKQNDVVMLGDFLIEGADADQNQLVMTKTLPDGRKVRYEVDEQGNRTNDVWGDPRNDREFTINKDGSASHTIKAGETVWSIAKDMLREKLGREPNNSEVAQAVKDIEKYNKENGEIKDANVTKPGQKLLIPPKDVAEVKKARGEEAGNEESKDATTTTTTKAGDKTYTVTRDAKGDAQQVEISDSQGNKRTYKRREDGQWEVDGKLAPEGSVAIGFKNNGTVVIADAAGETKIYKNGTVSVTPPGGKETITTADGTTYTQQENGDYVKRTAGGEESTIAAVNFHNDGGVISESTPQPQGETPGDNTNSAPAANQAHAFVGSMRPTNGVYNPIAPPGLAEANAAEEWDAETNYHKGLNADGQEDGDNWGVNSRQVTAKTDVSKDGVKLTEYAYKGELDGYLNVGFTGKQVIDGKGMVQSSTVEYGSNANGDGITLYVPNGRGGYDTIRATKKVETTFDAQKNVYTTVITNKDNVKVTYESDANGKNTKFVSATGGPPINCDWEWKPQR